ncbi:hypothetical protein EDB86DRAFT_2908546 [Lactarius hatsudake]|nr:hypothetical protein EDB86DRAFT_2908546 [Lactarius hatsudake]
MMAAVYASAGLGAVACSLVCSSLFTHLVIKAMRRQNTSTSSVSHYGIYNIAIRGDELGMLVRATIAGGGILPFIHKSLTAGKIKERMAHQRRNVRSSDFICSRAQRWAKAGT